MGNIYPLPPEFDHLSDPGRPYWLVIDFRMRAWARDVQAHLSALERSGGLMMNDAAVRGLLDSIVDGTCTMVSKSKWLFCLDGLDDMCNLRAFDQRAASLGRVQ